MGAQAQMGGCARRGGDARRDGIARGGGGRVVRIGGKAQGRKAIPPRLARRNNGNALETFERQQILVARDDQPGLRRQGAGEHGIVVRIASDGQRRTFHLAQDGARGIEQHGGIETAFALDR